MSDRGEVMGVCGDRGRESSFNFTNTFLMECGSGGTNSGLKRHRNALGGKSNWKRRFWRRSQGIR